MPVRLRLLPLVLALVAGLATGERVALGEDLPDLEAVAEDPSALESSALAERLLRAEREIAKLREQLDGGELDDVPEPTAEASGASQFYGAAAVPGGFEFQLDDLKKQFADFKAKATEIKYPTVKVNGFLQADTLYFEQDAANINQIQMAHPVLQGGLPHNGVIQDGSGFRRTRLSASGAVAENANYFIQMDFGFFGRPTFTDVWGELTQVPGVGNVKIGQWKQPFGLEVVSSVRYQPFLERSVLFQTFEPFRHIGVGVYDTLLDQRATYALSAFRTGQDQFGNDIGNQGGWSTAGRVTALPWYREEHGSLDYLHLGAAFWFGDPGTNIFRFATIPEAFVGSFSTPAGTIPGTSRVQSPNVANGTPPFVDTGNFPVENFTNYGVEALWVRGPFSIQSEAQLATVRQPGGLPNLTFPGAYLFGSYFLTGESRPYDRKLGGFDRVRPIQNFMTNSGAICGPGAWEVLCRVSYIDLNDDNISGGNMHDLTAGLNWYLNPYFKIQFNYINSTLNRFGLKGHADIYGLRCQVDF